MTFENSCSEDTDGRSTGILHRKFAYIIHVLWTENCPSVLWSFIRSYGFGVAVICDIFSAAAVPHLPKHINESNKTLDLAPLKLKLGVAFDSASWNENIFSSGLRTHAPPKHPTEIWSHWQLNFVFHYQETVGEPWHICQQFTIAYWKHWFLFSRAWRLTATRTCRLTHRWAALLRSVTNNVKHTF